MKILFMLLALMFTTLSMASDPNYCGGKNNCVKGYIPLLRSGTYNARGFGRTCQEAMDNSQSMFMREYGDMDCGLISGPYVWSCSKLSNSKYSAWTRCNPDSGSSSRRSNRGKCALVGGIIMC